MPNNLKRFEELAAGPLNEFTKDEWWDVCHSVKPDINRDEFDVAWKEFCDWRRRKIDESRKV